MAVYSIIKYHVALQLWRWYLTNWFSMQYVKDVKNLERDNLSSKSVRKQSK